MRFVLYTDKTVSQCMSALNERLHTRSNLNGWVEKGGRFSLTLTSKVAQRFTRKTQLRAESKREGGVTVIRGDVPSGAPPRAQLVIYVALALVGIALFFSGNAILAIVTALAAAALYIPLTGDHYNSAVLVSEVQRTLKAKETPPKKTDTKSAAARPKTAVTGVSRPVSRTQTKKPQTTTRTAATTKK